MTGKYLGFVTGREAFCSPRAGKAVGCKSSRHGRRILSGRLRMEAVADRREARGNVAEGPVRVCRDRLIRRLLKRTYSSIRLFSGWQ
jgi:hypothetical protein